MNLGLTTSFIIGGLLMIAIVSLNVRMGQNSADITLHNMNQNYISSVSEIIKFDFPKIGYAVDGPLENAILTAEENLIVFRSNLFNDPAGSVQTVTWSLGEDLLSGSDNPRHRPLLRTVDIDVQEIKIGVTRFELRYYMPGNETPLGFPIGASQLEHINRVEVILQVEPKEGLGRNNEFTTSSWRKVFTPPNLNIGD